MLACDYLCLLALTPLSLQPLWSGEGASNASPLAESSARGGVSRVRRDTNVCRPNIIYMSLSRALSLSAYVCACAQVVLGP